MAAGETGRTIMVRIVARQTGKSITTLYVMPK
jgi:hypothetical protein